MLLGVVAILGVLLVFLWRWGGAVRALLIGWLICLTPTAIGLVYYDYLVFAGDRYLWIIVASIAAYLLGAGLMISIQARRYQPQQGAVLAVDFAKWQGTATTVLVIAAASILFTIINFVTGGLNLTDLAAVRAEVIEMTGANIWARLAAVTGWACFLSLGYGIYFRSELGLPKTLLYVAGGTGVFFSMLTLAGRNSVLQLIIFCLVIEALRKAKMRKEDRVASGLSARAAVLLTGVSYLIYITVNRPGNLDVVDRNSVLLRLFNVGLNPTLDALLDRIQFIKGPIVEFLIYVTHTAPLFSVHLDIDYQGLFYGVFSFPFVARQLEPLHGMSVAAALDLKRVYVESAGVIGFGWTTALSSFLMDFGLIGCLVIMFVQGLIAQYLQICLRRGEGFVYAVMYALMIISAAFMPFIAAFADTNLFLLMIVLLVIARRQRPPPVLPVVAGR